MGSRNQGLRKKDKAPQKELAGVSFYTAEGEVKMMADSDAMYLGKLPAKEFRKAIIGAIREVAAFRVDQLDARAQADVVVDRLLPGIVEKMLPGIVHDLAEGYLRDELRARVRTCVADLDITLEVT